MSLLCLFSIPLCGALEVQLKYEIIDVSVGLKVLSWLAGSEDKAECWSPCTHPVVLRHRAEFSMSQDGLGKERNHRKLVNVLDCFFIVNLN